MAKPGPLAVCAACALAVNCGGAQKSDAQVEDPALARCAADYARTRLAPSAEIRSKLDGYMFARLQRWFSDMGFAECANDYVRKAEVQSQSIAVNVSHGGDLAALAEAGLSPGFDSGGTVSGQLELRRVLDVAAQPQVTLVEAQPVPTPDAE